MGCTLAALTTAPPHGQCAAGWRVRWQTSGVSMSLCGQIFDERLQPAPATLRRRRLPARLIVIAILWSFAATAEAAAEWPEKPVRLVVPFAAGGAADVIGRLFADNLSAVFSQQFVVENRPGAGGIVGAQSVARADPDGYTLMGAGMSSHVPAPATHKHPGHDPASDF